LSVAAAGAAEAAPVTYNIGLTSSPYSYSGTITLASAPVSSGNEDFYAGAGWTALSLTIDGVSFTLANKNSSSTYVEFQNGTLNGFAFVGTQGNASLQLGGRFYTFSDQTTRPQLFAQGMVTLTPAPSTAVPEPASIALFAPLAIFVGTRLRRKRKTAA
jgi:hypothetical protein